MNSDANPPKNFWNKRVVPVKKLNYSRPFKWKRKKLKFNWVFCTDSRAHKKGLLVVRWINEGILHMPIYCVTGFHSLLMLITDNGGGMTPDRMRACMSLGYSAKSKMANTIGQCKPFNQIISSYWNSGICHLIKLLFYIIQMEMASKLVQWGLGQMWLCFLAVGGRMETGFFITLIWPKCSFRSLTCLFDVPI